MKRIKILLLVLTLSVGCGLGNLSSYSDLVKSQTLSILQIPNNGDSETIGDVLNKISKGKVVWESSSMPENDSEYRYRNIHKTSVLVSASFPVNYRINERGQVLLLLPIGSTVILTIEFAVKKDKSEFQLYRLSFDGEYQSEDDMISVVKVMGLMFFNESYDFYKGRK